MDPKYDQIFSNLRHKIKTIISLFEEQKIHNQELLEKNREMGEKIRELENKLEKSEKEFEQLKMAKVLSSVTNEDIHDTKIQVNRIVREIDKCIALLNR